MMLQSDMESKQSDSPLINFFKKIKIKDLLQVDKYDQQLQS